MSLAGLRDFGRCLDAMMESKRFKEASEAERLEMGARLLRCGGAPNYKKIAKNIKKK